jgi:hypothetical protein
MEFVTTTLDNCLDIRHPVLWPHLPRDASRVEGDDDALHFGVLHNGKLVSCLSVFMLDASVCQIRKFATLEAYQGRALAAFCCSRCWKRWRQPGYMTCVWMRVSGPSISTTNLVSVPKANTSSKKGWSTCGWCGGKGPIEQGEGSIMRAAGWLFTLSLLGRGLG